MTRRAKVLFAIAVVCVVAAAGYAGMKRQAAVATLAPQAIVEFTQQDLHIVEPQPLERTLPLTGTLTPFTEATLKAKVPGELVQVAVREGESVKQGQVLARIDPTEVQARVAGRQADVAAARAQLVWAQKNRDTQKALLDKAFISQNAFDNIQSNYDVALARLRAAEAELVVAQEVARRRGAGGAFRRHGRAAPRAGRRARGPGRQDHHGGGSLAPAAGGRRAGDGDQQAARRTRRSLSASTASASASSAGASSASIRRRCPARARSMSTPSSTTPTACCAADCSPRAR